MRALKGLSGGEKWVLLMTALTLALALANVGRAVVALRYAAQIPGLETRMPLPYAAGTGLFWGLSLSICAGGLFAAREWGRVSTMLAITLYQAHIWLNRFWFDASDYALQTRPRDLILTGVLLALYWGTLSLRPVRQVFSRDTHEVKRPHPRSEEAHPSRKEIDWS
jgi:hypothetical protein